MYLELFHFSFHVIFKHVYTRICLFFLYYCTIFFISSQVTPQDDIWLVAARRGCCTTVAIFHALRSRGPRRGLPFLEIRGSLTDSLHRIATTSQDVCNGVDKYVHRFPSRVRRKGRSRSLSHGVDISATFLVFFFCYEILLKLTETEQKAIDDKDKNIVKTNRES